VALKEPGMSETTASLIGTNLRLARLRSGLTQKDLALRSGLRQPDVSRIEKGGRSVSLEEALVLGGILNVPLQWFLTGAVRPGKELPDLAADLRFLGMVDLLVPSARLPGAFRSAEEALVCAVGVDRPDPRVVEALPAVLAWNRWRPGVLEALARAEHPRAAARLAWLAECVLVIDRQDRFPGGMVSGEDLVGFLDRISRPDEPDDLGYPAVEESVHRIWSYWRIRYAGDLTAFRLRAQRLHGLRSRSGYGRIPSGGGHAGTDPALLEGSR
jgi:transcriptional regulator with XRE-family HTH domain